MWVKLNWFQMHIGTQKCATCTCTFLAHLFTSSSFFFLNSAILTHTSSNTSPSASSWLNADNHHVQHVQKSVTNLISYCSNDGAFIMCSLFSYLFLISIKLCPQLSHIYLIDHTTHGYRILEDFLVVGVVWLLDRIEQLKGKKFKSKI